MRHCLAAPSSLRTKGHNHEINYEKMDTYLISLVSFSIVTFNRETTIVIIFIIIITILVIIIQAGTLFVTDRQTSVQTPWKLRMKRYKQTNRRTHRHIFVQITGSGQNADKLLVVIIYRLSSWSSGGACKKQNT